MSPVVYYSISANQWEVWEKSTDDSSSAKSLMSSVTCKEKVLCIVISSLRTSLLTTAWTWKSLISVLPHIRKSINFNHTEVLWLIWLQKSRKERPMTESKLISFPAVLSYSLSYRASSHSRKPKKTNISIIWSFKASSINTGIKLVETVYQKNSKILSLKCSAMIQVRDQLLKN